MRPFTPLLVLLLPTAASAAKLDAWGDPLPPFALFRTGSLRDQHDVAGPLSFSPDGQLLAATERDAASIRLWDAATGKKIRSLPGHSRRVWCFCFSADGKSLASGDDNGTVRLWDVATGKELRQIDAHRQGVSKVALAPDGTWLASTDGSDLRFWDLPSGKQTRSTPAGQSGTFQSLALSADGKLLAAGCMAGPVRLWETSSGREVDVFKGRETAAQPRAGYSLEESRSGTSIRR
jgi:WD40 repeat protein